MNHRDYFYKVLLNFQVMLKHALAQDAKYEHVVKLNCIYSFVCQLHS